MNDLEYLVDRQLQHLKPVNFARAMPNDDRQRWLRQIDAQIHQLLRLQGLKPAREQLRHLIDLRHNIERSRYLTRPTSYHNHELTHEGPNRYPSSPTDYKTLLRMSETEFERLVVRFGRDPVFVSTGKKPQAPPKLQLACFMHRLASGNSVASVKAAFNLTSE